MRKLMEIGEDNPEGLVVNAVDRAIGLALDWKRNIPGYNPGRNFLDACAKATYGVDQY